LINWINRLSAGLLEKETLDLNAIIGILGERPFAPKSNFKAYLENKREDHSIENNEEKQAEVGEEQEDKDEDEDNKRKVARQTA